MVTARTVVLAAFVAAAASLVMMGASGSRTMASVREWSPVGNATGERDDSLDSWSTRRLARYCSGQRTFFTPRFAPYCSTGMMFGFQNPFSRSRAPMPSPETSRNHFWARTRRPPPPLYTPVQHKAESEVKPVAPTPVVPKPVAPKPEPKPLPLICPAGKEVDASGKMCQQCQGNTFSRAGGKCTDCPKGSVSIDKNTGCLYPVVCRPGQEPNDSMRKCQFCKDGTYSKDGKECKPCPTNGSSNADKTECICPNNAVTNNNECIQCLGDLRPAPNGETCECPPDQVPESDGSDKCRKNCASISGATYEESLNGGEGGCKCDKDNQEINEQFQTCECKTGFVINRQEECELNCQTKPGSQPNEDNTECVCLPEFIESDVPIPGADPPRVEERCVANCDQAIVGSTEENGKCVCPTDQVVFQGKDEGRFCAVDCKGKKNSVPNAERDECICPPSEQGQEIFTRVPQDTNLPLVRCDPDCTLFPGSRPTPDGTECECDTPKFKKEDGECVLDCTQVKFSTGETSADGKECLCKQGRELNEAQDECVLKCSDIDVNSEPNATGEACVCKCGFILEGTLCVEVTCPPGEIVNPNCPLPHGDSPCILQ